MIFYTYAMTADKTLIYHRDRNRIIEAIETNVSTPPSENGGFSVYGVII